MDFTFTRRIGISYYLLFMCLWNASIGCDAMRRVTKFYIFSHVSLIISDRESWWDRNYEGSSRLRSAHLSLAHQQVFSIPDSSRDGKVGL